MNPEAMQRIETCGLLCEESLRQAAEAEAEHKQADADAYRECARLWSDRAFKEAQA